MNKGLVSRNFFQGRKLNLAGEASGGNRDRIIQSLAGASSKEGRKSPRLRVD